MFTGIIKGLGRVKSLSGNELVIEQEGLDEVSIGDSIAVNGVCLTVVNLNGSDWSSNVVPETFSRTALGDLTVGDLVNIERPLALGAPLDGHLVQGHVDGVGKILSRSNSHEIRIEASGSLLQYVIEKGSIAVDGISLTVTTVDETSFGIALIPHTAKVTTLGSKPIGARVNLEVDMMAKYAEKLIKRYSK